MDDPLELLLAQLRDAPWPLPREEGPRAAVRTGRALRKGDEDWLKRIAGWDPTRDYIRDPLPKRIAQGFADFLFAEDADFTAVAADGSVEQDQVDRFAEVNGLQARLHRAARLCVSEGEVWWKLHVAQAVADMPLLTFCSRLHVVPLLYDDRVLAVAFVSEVCREAPGGMEEDDHAADLEDIVWRHFEIHGPGRVANVLFRGTPGRIGQQMDLTARPETAGYNPDWQHGLGLLAGRVVNDLDDDPACGTSEFEQVQDLLLALNEAVTISSENARLTGKDRMFVAGRFTQADGSFDASLEVFQVEQEGSTLGEGAGAPPIYGIEKTYDADALWTHIAKLVHTILTRVGLVAEFIGDTDRGGGANESGTARRLRFMPTVNASKGKARAWLAELPKIVHLALQVAALPAAQGGFGGPAPAEDRPGVQLADPLPRDESERVQDAATAVVAQIMSRRTAIREQHPDWSDDQIDEELAAIADDEGRATGSDVPPGEVDPPPAPGPADDPTAVPAT